MKNLLLAILAYIIVHVTMLPVMFFRLLFFTPTNKDFKDYMFAIAIGLDQLGGSYLYGKPDWTVSSYTHHLTCQGSVAAYKFREVIDFMFGKGHCYNSYINEVATHRKELDDIRRARRG
jgi:hypothetical protein